MQENARPVALSWLSFRSAVTAMVCCLSLLVLAVFFFSLAARYFLVAELINSFRTQITSLLLICACLLLLLRQKAAGWTLLLVSGWQLLMLASVFLPSSQPPAGDQRLKIMSMNVWCDNKQFQQVIDHVKDVSPDVLLVIEYSNQWHHGLQPLHAMYPHRLLQPRWHGYGIALFSKRPLKNTEVWQLTADQTDVPALSAEVKVGDHNLRLAGLHTMSPTSSLRIDLRNDQMNEIAGLVGKRDQPTILMGDFNCTPWSPFFKDMIVKCGYRDSRRGQGYLASWNLNLPTIFWIPIDHALVSDDVHVHCRSVGKACGSDHRPMMIEVSIDR